MSLENFIKNYKSEVQAMAVTAAIILTSNAISYFHTKESLTYSNCYFTNEKLLKYKSQNIVNKLFIYGSKNAIEIRLEELDCK